MPCIQAPKPEDGPSVIAWAAYWAPKVAKEIGLFQGWHRGDAATIRQVALALPLVVATYESELELKKWAVQLVAPISTKDYLKAEKAQGAK